jgi:uncharacterized protein
MKRVLSRKARHSWILAFLPFVAIWEWTSPCEIAKAGPSFDCSKSLSAVEHLICDEPQLGNLDGKLASAFAARRSQLNTEEFKQLLKEQRAWLRIRTDICGVPNPSRLAADNAKSIQCLLHIYRERISSLNKQVSSQYNAASSDTSVKETRSDIDPGFWGIDLLEAFPDWRHSYLHLNEVFEGPSGELVGRFDVGNKADDNLKSWEVDFINKTRRPYSAANTMRYRRVQSTTYVPFGIANSKYRIQDGDRGSNAPAEPCEDPLRDTIELRERQPNDSTEEFDMIKSILLVVKIKSPDYLGGDCGEDGSDERTYVPIVARSVLGELFGLSDQTFLVQAGIGQGNVALIIRFNEQLNTQFKSRQYVSAPTSAYESLLQEKGIVGAQREILSHLN